MSFSADIIIGAAPLQVQFTDTTTGSIKSWYWQFGDSETSTEQNPIHIYTEEGRYTVSLEVTYDDDSTETFTETEYILVDEVALEADTKCLRYATSLSEGYGWSEYSGDDIAVPMDNYGAFIIKDDNGKDRDIIIDDSDFGIYEIDTCDRYINKTPSPVDKGSTEVSWEKWEKEDVLDEDKRVKHESSCIGIRPSDPAHRDAAGYTATGLRANQQIDIEAYVDGEKITPSAKAKKVTEARQVTFTGMNLNDHRTQMVIKGSAGQVHITSHRHRYLHVAGSPTPTNRLDGDYSLLKELFTNKVLWLSRGSRPLLNRCSGEVLTGGTVTVIEGPDGRDSGFLCTENITCDNAAVSSECTVIMWSKSSSLITGLSGWSTYGDAVDGWTLYYNRATGGISANLEIIAGSRFDVRVYSKRVSDAAIAELYDNIVNYEGKKVMS